MPDYESHGDSKLSNPVKGLSLILKPDLPVKHPGQVCLGLTKQCMAALGWCTSAASFWVGCCCIVVL